jgi:RHS repeat-associated protein
VGYDLAGNVTGASDINSSGGSVMGAWTYAYDTLNRLTAGHNTATTAASIQYANMYGCWAYDDFGNRTANDPLWATACPAQESSLTPTDTYNTNNQMDPSTKSYDPSGNMTADSSTGNTYLYDGEGRICAVSSTPVSGFTTMTGYVYDAGGNRVAKGTITSMSCDPSVNGIATANNETDYVLGPGGEQVTELAQDANGTMNWQRTYVYGAGGLIATYDPNPDTPSQPLPSFRLTDWLGTLRATTDAYGVAQGTCTGLPYGDGVSCSGDIPDNHHFTGKERDAETGNDYFGARYFASNMGRFMSPDWSAKIEPVPYSKLDDPQTLNLYGYLRDNPLGGVDADGHCGEKPNDPPCPSMSKDDKAAVKDAVDRSNKPTSDDKKGKHHEEGVVTGKDANGNHVIVPAKPGAYSDVTKPGGKATVNPSIAADPSKQNTVVSPEVVAHVHPAGTDTSLTTNSAGQTIVNTSSYVQTPSQQDLDAAIPAPGINLVVGAGSTGNASGLPTVYFYDSSGTTCTESYTDFLK